MKKILLLTFFLGGCSFFEPIESEISKRHNDPKLNRAGKNMTIKVIVSSSEKEVNRLYPLRYLLYESFAGVKALPTESSREYSVKKGFTVWNTIDSNNNPMCLIVVPKIASMNSRDTFITWGHELAHCIYGAYHKEERF